jgi:hypothetical protein
MKYPKFLKILIFCLYFIGAAAVLLLFSVKDYEPYEGYKDLRGFDGLWASRFPDMVYGEAHKPWVYRTLLPSTVRGISLLLPDSIKERGSDLGIKFGVVEKLGWNADYFADYVIALILMFFCLIGFAFVIRALFAENYKSSSLIRDVIPIFALAGIPILFKYYSYIYDFPTLFLFSLGLWLIIKKKWSYFYPVFLLGCINKETTILLSLVFLIYFFKNKMSKTKLLQHISSQFLIFAAVKSILLIAFQNNPGQFVVMGFWMLARNINKVASLYTLPTFVSYLVLSILIIYRWQKKPIFLKQGLYILIPLLSFAMFFGYIDELRGYYEVYPVVFLLIVHSLSEVLGLRVMTRE